MRTKYWDVYAPTVSSAALSPLLPYLDSFIVQLAADFGYTIFPLPGQPRLILFLDPTMPLGAASAGTDKYGPYSVGISAASVGATIYGVANFWYYLLSLHETINIWTGTLAQGWPWADGSDLWKGSSPFPSACDIVITEELGLTAVSSGQVQNVGSDPGVQLILSLQKTYGWKVFQDLFSYIQKQIISDLAAYSEPLRTAIICWFLSYSCGTDLLPQFNSAVYAKSGLTIPQAAYQQAQSLFPNPSEQPTTLTMQIKQ